MLDLKKVGITGGLSSGKTTVCQFFKKLGAYVVSADEIVHKLLSPNTPIGQEVIRLLGEEILREDRIDRAQVAKQVFENKEKLKLLEKILHPAVLKEIEEEFNQVKNQENYSLFVAEVPLLYESEGHDQFDTVVAVVADRPIAKRRFKSSEEEFEMRMTHQLTPEEKSGKADYTISNDQDLPALERQVAQLYSQLTQ